MSELAAGILEQLKEPDRRPVSQWAVGNVLLPHSKRAREWSEDTAYWLIEPLNAIPECEAVSLCKPTQTGGTTVYEVFLAWLIANCPSDASMMGHTDDDTMEIFRTKILPTLKASPATAALLAAAPRNAITKNRMDLGTMQFRVHGCGLNSMQSASLEVLLLDECWRFPMGTILEILERTSTRAATRKIVSVSQAGEERTDRNGKPCWDEWGNWWHRGTQEVFRVVCPHCSSRFEPETSQFKCAETARDPLTKEWNWNTVLKTTFLETPCCKERIENTPVNRRRLSATGRYFATNPNPAPRHRSFRYSSWVVYWQDWGDLLSQFLRAQEARKQGNLEPLKIFTQKKESRWWMLAQQEIPLEIIRQHFGYKLTDYKDGTPWDDAPFRFMAADYQQDCFKVCIRDFKIGGDSRLIWQGTLRSWEELAQKAAHYRLEKTHVCVDAGNWTQEVYKQCAKRGWIAMHGDDRTRWPRRSGGATPHSPAFKGKVTTIKKDMGGRKAEGKAFCFYYQWSNLIYKDWFAMLSNGKGLPWEYADDVEEEYMEALDSEKRLTGKNGKPKWEKIGKRRDHYKDAELMILARANIKGGIFVSMPEPESDVGDDGEESPSD